MAKPKLSVTLISSGRGNTVEKCLSSLDQFKEYLPTEVVVVDTDPDHNEDIHAILEKYADKIIPFEWINDFSAARNAGIKQCTGEWLFILDDDEWMIESQQIIDFLKSEESEKYNWADCLVRNYLDPEYKTSGDAWVTRLIRREEDTCYKGVVHEYLQPLRGESKTLHAVIGHSGYIYLTQEAKIQHAHRNISLLEQALKDNPQEMRWWQHLLQEYDVIDNKVKIRETCDFCLKMMEDYESAQVRRIRGLFVAARMRVDRAEHKWKESLKTYDAYGSKREYGKVVNSWLDIECALLFYHLDDFEKSRKYLHSYFEKYEKLHDKTDSMTIEMTYFLKDTFDENVWGLALSLMIHLDIKAGDWSSFEQYFDRLRWTDGAPYDFRAFARQFVIQMTQTEYDEHFVTMAKTLWASKPVREIITNVLQETAGIKDMGYWRVVRIFSDKKIQDPIPWDIRILQADHTKNEDFDYSMHYRELFQLINPFLMDKDLWSIAADHSIDLPSIIKEVPFSKWQRNVDYYLDHSAPDVQMYLLSFLESLPMGREEHLLYFTKGTREAILVDQAKPDKDKPEEKNKNVLDEYQQLRGELSRLCMDTLTFYRKLYKPELFEEESGLLPSECQLMLRLDRVLSMDEEDYRSILARLKEMIGIHPEMDEVLNRFSHVYADAVKEGRIISTPADEMRQLAAALQEKARQLADAGMKDEAEKIMEQLRQFALTADNK